MTVLKKYKANKTLEGREKPLGDIANTDLQRNIVQILTDTTGLEGDNLTVSNLSRKAKARRIISRYFDGREANLKSAVQIILERREYDKKEALLKK